MRLTVAAVQAAPIYLDLSASLAKAETLIGQAAARAVSRSVYMIAVMVKSVFGIVGAYLFRSHTNGLCQHVAGAGLCRAQFRFEFAKS